MSLKPLKACRVLVTPTSYGKNNPALRRDLEAAVGEVIYNTTGKPYTAADLVSLIPGFDGYIAGLDVIDRRVIEVADQLCVIARYGVGVDSVDLEAARQKGIVVTNTPTANSTSVAELTVGLLLSLARGIPAAVQAVRAGEWPRHVGLSLEGKVIGLVGFGAVGQRVAQRLGGFECTLLAYDPFPNAAEAARLGVQLLSLEAVACQADFLSLHCPMTPGTRGMVNAAFLAGMKNGAFLINTARGELVVEEDLVQALNSGKLRGAALDVFSSQPPDPANPLLHHPGVMATPHMGAHTDGATDAMGFGALHDCLAVLSGHPPRHRVV